MTAYLAQVSFPIVAAGAAALIVGNGLLSWFRPVPGMTVSGVVLIAILLAGMPT